VLWSAVEFVGFGAAQGGGDGTADEAQQLSDADVAALKDVMEGK
jgi:hypothetical protein